MEKEVLHRWKNLDTLFTTLLMYAQLGARNRQFLHGLKVTERVALIANSAYSRNQANAFAYQLCTPLNDFLATMLCCVACPLYADYLDRAGAARMPLERVLRNPYFERSGTPDPESRGVLQPTPELMKQLASGSYFSCKCTCVPRCHCPLLDSPVCLWPNVHPAENISYIPD